MPLTSGFLVAIVGRPNVGKSTLFNRLSRSRKAIVDDLPGVTRDRNYELVTYGDRTFTVVDTGGFEPVTENPILVQMREQAVLAVEEADLVVFMADGREGLTPGDREVFQLLRCSAKPVLVAVNKIDGPEHDDLMLESHEMGAETLFPLSASHGYGIPSLLDEIVAHLPEPSAAEIGEEEGIIRLSVIGRPNVGKSSLINAVLGENRLLVSEIPGTTRDTIDSVIKIEDRTFVLTDTAGIRRKSKVAEKLEKFTIIRALKGIEQSHVAVVVMDASEGVTDQDAKIAGYAYERGRAVVLVLNKWDLVPPEMRNKNPFLDQIEQRMKYLAFAPIVTTSALSGKRVSKIFGAVKDVYAQYTTHIATAALNRMLEDTVQRHTPPRYKNLTVRLNYITQSDTMPPTFTIFTNRPEGVHFSYQRYVINRIENILVWT